MLIHGHYNCEAGCTTLTPEMDLGGSGAWGAADMILASGSPTRSRLLRDAGYEFRVVVPTDREGALAGAGLPPRAFVEAQAYLKARDVADRLEGGVVIGADTVTTVATAAGERLLGKPATPAEARAMLAALSGRTHEVVTGLAVLDVRGGRRVITSARTVLRMKPLSAAELDALSLLPDATAASGGYALREGGDDLVTIVEGSASNVVGLPLELLAKVLRLVERPGRA